MPKRRREVAQLAIPREARSSCGPIYAHPPLELPGAHGSGDICAIGNPQGVGVKFGQLETRTPLDLAGMYVNGDGCTVGKPKG